MTVVCVFTNSTLLLLASIFVHSEQVKVFDGESLNGKDTTTKALTAAVIAAATNATTSFRFFFSYFKEKKTFFSFLSRHSHIRLAL